MSYFGIWLKDSSSGQGDWARVDPYDDGSPILAFSSGVGAFSYAGRHYPEARDRRAAEVRIFGREDELLKALKDIVSHAKDGEFDCEHHFRMGMIHIWSVAERAIKEAKP